jgi:hypothetical protein
VLFGPAHPAGAEAAFRRSGIDVRRVGGDPRRHWAALGEAVAGADAERVLITMPDVTAGPSWLRRAAESLDGDRVAVVLGHDPQRRNAEYAPYLRSRLELVERYPAIEPPFHYVVLHRARFLELGGFEAGLDALGWYAPPLELAERALDAGLVIMRQRVAGLELPGRPLRPWRRREWQRQQARGALIAREGARRAGAGGAALAVARGTLPLAADVARRRAGPVIGAARVVAYLYGARPR